MHDLTDRSEARPQVDSHFRALCPRSCARTLAAVPELSFVWDFNHTTPEHLAAFQVLIPRMSMVHVSDTPLPAVNSHLPLGQSMLDLAARCRALRSAPLARPMILEIGGLPKSGAMAAIPSRR